MPSDAIEKILQTLRAHCLSEGRTLDNACRHLESFVDREVVAEARRRYEQDISRIKTLKDPAAMTAEEHRYWYPGPRDDDRFWPALKQLLEEKGWDDTTIETIDEASTRIVSLLEHPGLGSFHTKGLVLGYVQSGKTANFTAVTAKAADAGYRMFIVMSGLTKSLRRQTQLRLNRELVHPNREHWVNLTDEWQDFGDLPAGTATAFLGRYSQQKVLAVVKKNHSRLRKLRKWLSEASREVIGNCPILIVDDEADQATVNTSGDPEDPTRINGLIRGLLDDLPKAAYVGYTATPFANILIDPRREDPDSADATTRRAA